MTHNLYLKGKLEYHKYSIDSLLSLKFYKNAKIYISSVVNTISIYIITVCKSLKKKHFPRREYEKLT